MGRLSIALSIWIAAYRILKESHALLTVWYGLLFIRRGVYKGAVLRFNLHLPDDFPSKTVPVSSLAYDYHVRNVYQK